MVTMMLSMFVRMVVMVDVMVVIVVMRVVRISVDGEDYDEDEGGPGLCCEVVIPPQCGGRDRGAGQDLITRDS